MVAPRPIRATTDPVLDPPFSLSLRRPGVLVTAACSRPPRPGHILRPGCRSIVAAPADGLAFIAWTARRPHSRRSFPLPRSRRLDFRDRSRKVRAAWAGRALRGPDDLGPSPITRPAAPTWPPLRSIQYAGVESLTWMIRIGKWEPVDGGQPAGRFFRSGDIDASNATSSTCRAFADRNDRHARDETNRSVLSQRVRHV